MADGVLDKEPTAPAAPVEAPLTMADVEKATYKGA